MRADCGSVLMAAASAVPAFATDVWPPSGFEADEASASPPALLAMLRRDSLHVRLRERKTRCLETLASLLERLLLDCDARPNRLLRVQVLLQGLELLVDQ
eukprot:10159438-Alexandrium_andersonii.AAC.1